MSCPWRSVQSVSCYIDGLAPKLRFLEGEEDSLFRNCRRTAR